MEYMGIGHRVKVTREDHDDFNKEGIIKSKEAMDFVVVDFGTHEKKHNVGNLLDLTLKEHEDKNKFSKVKVSYMDYPSVDEVSAFIFFGYITKIIKPLKRMFSYWDMDDKEIDIEPISREEIQTILENENYALAEDDACTILQLDFDEDNSLCISPNGEDTLEYFWDDKE